jgi:hypothetical protein
MVDSTTNGLHSLSGYPRTTTAGKDIVVRRDTKTSRLTWWPAGRSRQTGTRSANSEIRRLGPSSPVRATQPSGQSHRIDGLVFGLISGTAEGLDSTMPTKAPMSLTDWSKTASASSTMSATPGGTKVVRSPDGSHFCPNGTSASRGRHRTVR